MAVTSGIGTTTFDRGVSFVSTSKPKFLLRGHTPQVRNSSTTSRLPMIEVALMKAAMLVSFGSQVDRAYGK
jgi:hypothetical protein